MTQPKRKQAGRFTEPSLPPHVIVNDGGITIQHFYRSGDHGPPHLHIDGGGMSTRIGQNGYPLAGDPPLSSAQQTVVAENLRIIRRAVRKIGRWRWFDRVV